MAVMPEGAYAYPERFGNDFLCFLYDCIEMRGTSEAFGVDLVDVFGAGRAGGEPAVLAL